MRILDLSRYSHSAAALCLGTLLSACGSPAFVQPGVYHQNAINNGVMSRESKVGGLRYFPALPNASYRSSNLVKGPQNTLWYVNQSKSSSGYSYSITRFTRRGIKALTKTYAIPGLCRSCPPLTPTTIVSGPDRRVWFGTTQSYVIGAMDMRGKVTYYGVCRLPERCDIVLGPVVGQDIWFTLEELSSTFHYSLTLGYFDTSTGTTKTYATGIENATPSQLTPSPYGAFWLGIGTNVVELAPYTTEEFPTNPPMNVGSIVFGPDQDLWFVGNGRVVGRMQTDGQMLSEKRLPRGDETDQILLGPDDDVWVTTAHAIVRMRSATSYIRIEVPKRASQCKPAGIALGPDGALWFSSTSAGSDCTRGIGKVLLK